MYDEIIDKVSGALVEAGSVFRQDKAEAYRRAIERETSDNAKWALEMIMENALVAKDRKSPLCDDTGIPHLFLEVGKKRTVTGELLDAIQSGVAEGLRKLPGRPMALEGYDTQRIDQSGGISDNPGMVMHAPIIIKQTDEDVLRLHILMFGGGPAIRAKTYRIFHKHNAQVVIDEIVKWAAESARLLGCTPCTLAIGIGRSHFEAASLMVEAQVHGRYDVQSDMEKEITERVNSSGAGALGLGGNNTALAAFVRVGPQRASGVRIVSMRPCCCFEPRIASVELQRI